MQRLIRCLLFLNFSCFVLIGCSKNESPTQQPASTEKKLNAVVFKASDNPGLQEDIPGIITNDSIKVKFPSNILLNALIPTIDFTGASIAPANRTPQNFTNPVNYTITAQDGSTKAFSFNCTYRTHSDSATMIMTRWGVIKDSVTNNNYAFPNGGGYPIPGVYIGVANDFYDFNTNGTLYIFENNNSGSHPYQILPGGQIGFTYPFIFYQGTIQYLSLNRMTIFWSLTSSNGGQYTRTLYLKR